MRIKKIITVLTIAVMSILPTMSAGASSATNGIVFDGDSQQFVTDIQGAGFTGMLPGEEQTVSFRVTNDDAQELRFYMSAAVLDNIAAAGASKSAVYDFAVTRNNETTPILAAAIGSEIDVSAGLDLLTADNRILVDTLAKGEFVDISISLALSGATDNSYQDQLGEIQLQFSAETEDPAPVVTQTRTETVTSSSSIQTGDDNQIFLYMGLAIGAAVIMGSLLVALKKKNKKNKRNMMMLGLLVLGAGMLIPSNVALASAPSYEVSFKAGVNGTINGGGSVDVMVEYGKEINLDTYAAMINPEDDYVFSGWSTGESGTLQVEESAKLIAQYNRIVTEASYTVNYVDDFGNEIFTQKVAMTELGTQVFENAPTIEGYTATVATQSAVIDEKNGIEINFLYTTDPTIVTEVNTVVVPGAATPAATPAAPAAAAATPAAVAVPDDGVPLADAPGDDENDNGTDAGNETDEAEIPDEDLPLAGGMDKETEANTLQIVMGVLAAILAIGVVVVIYFKKKNAEQ